MDGLFTTPTNGPTRALDGMAINDLAAMQGKTFHCILGLTAMTVFLLAFGFTSARGAATSGMADGPAFARLGPREAPVKLFYETKGSGAPILLIHGFGASTFTWRRIAPALAENYKVIAVDLKGFGQSDKPLDEHYSIFDQAKLIKQLIVEKDLKNLVLIGHSYGGGISLMLALDEDPRLEGRIAKLVLLDTIAYPQNIPVAFKMMDMPVVSHLGVRMVPPEMQARVALKLAYFDDTKIGDEDVEMYAAPLRTTAGKQALSDNQAADADRVVRQRPDRPARYRPRAAPQHADLPARNHRTLRTHATRRTARGNAEAHPGLFGALKRICLRQRARS